MNSNDKEPAWKQALSPITSEFKKSPFLFIAFCLSFVIYVFGFFFNNLQNHNILFSTAWFYDAVILSWTNLLVIPLLLIQIPWRLKERDWSEFKLIAKMHLYSPAGWIVGFLGLRIIYKLLLGLDNFFTNFFNWLAS